MLKALGESVFANAYVNKICVVNIFSKNVTYKHLFKEYRCMIIDFITENKINF